MRPSVRHGAHDTANRATQLGCGLLRTHQNRPFPCRVARSGSLTAASDLTGHHSTLSASGLMAHPRYSTSFNPALDPSPTGRLPRPLAPPSLAFCSSSYLQTPAAPRKKSVHFPTFPRPWSLPPGRFSSARPLPLLTRRPTPPQPVRTTKRRHTPIPQPTGHLPNLPATPRPQSRHHTCLPLLLQGCMPDRQISSPLSSNGRPFGPRPPSPSRRVEVPPPRHRTRRPFSLFALPQTPGASPPLWLQLALRPSLPARFHPQPAGPAPQSDPPAGRASRSSTSATTGSALCQATPPTY